MDHQGIDTATAQYVLEGATAMSTLHRTWVAGAPSGQRLGVVVQADKQCAEHLDLLGVKPVRATFS